MCNWRGSVPTKPDTIRKLPVTSCLRDTVRFSVSDAVFMLLNFVLSFGIKHAIGLCPRNMRWKFKVLPLPAYLVNFIFVSGERGIELSSSDLCSFLLAANTLDVYIFLVIFDQIEGWFREMLKSLPKQAVLDKESISAKMTGWPLRSVCPDARSAVDVGDPELCMRGDLGMPVLTQVGKRSKTCWTEEHLVPQNHTTLVWVSS